MSEMEELLQFLTIETRIDVKSLALHQVLGLTGTKEGRLMLLETCRVFQNLCALLNDKQPSVAKDASLALVNLSSDDDVIPHIVSGDMHVVHAAVNAVLDPEHELADPACMLLSNLTRLPSSCDLIYERTAPIIDKLIDVFCQKKYNKKGAKLHYLAPVFSNMSQLPAMRRHIMDRSKPLLQRLVSFTDYAHSIIRRGGIIGLIKNCCFETEHHAWLLSESVDLLPKILLPLAGPEEFSDEEYEKLPIELQYLGDEKTREVDPDVRLILLEALIQLCTTKFGREYLRSKNTYVILRELHKWEKDNRVLVSCEHLVNILIRYEHEIGHDNLKELEIPEELVVKFDTFDKEVVDQV